MEEKFASNRNEEPVEHLEPGHIFLSDLLQCLVEGSEKAAKIAQIFREENDLFDLLVQEKSEEESNKRFGQDFKTLADVLVQETIKKDVGQKFPELVSQIRGEEQNSFKNVKGDSIEVLLTDSKEDTVAMLVKVLNGKKHTAQAIADVVHSSEIVCEKQCHMYHTYPINNLGIWIDPIDSTAEFIEGKYDETQECGLQPYGLKCVCVLIGAYDLKTFSTVLGVINQPFYSKSSENGKWQSRFYWGINHGDNSLTPTNVAPISHTDLEKDTPRKKRIVVISSSENAELQDTMSHEYQVIHAAGAGYKALLVAMHKADLYFLSKGTTYYWDTCAPHAILNSIGGGLLNLKLFANDSDPYTLDSLQRTQVKYEAKLNESGTAMFQNCDGIIAYRDSSAVIEFLIYLKNSGYEVK